MRYFIRYKCAVLTSKVYSILWVLRLFCFLGFDEHKKFKVLFLMMTKNS